MSATSLRQRGSLAAVVAFALLATACGGSSSSGAAANSSGAGGTAAGAAATSAVGTTAGAAATTMAGTSKSAPTSAGPTPTKIVAKGGGTFCKDVAKVMTDAASTASSSSNTPAGVKALVQKGQAEVGFLAAEAPSDIKPDVAILAGAVAALYSAVAKANYDFTKVDPTAMTAMSSPTVTAASNKVDAYVKIKCGIDTGANASS